MDEQARIILNLMKKIEELEERLECIEQSKEKEQPVKIFEPLENINKERTINI